MEKVDSGLRNFIRQLGVIVGGAAILPIAPWLASCIRGDGDETPKERLAARIGLIGVGSRGQYHIHNLLTLPNARIVALCDNYRPNLEQAGALVPGARTYSDYRKMLEDRDIDGVVISTPLGSHARITLDCMAAGKHVFCEKSMALTFDECRKVYDAYRANDRVLYYCMQRMFDKKYIEAVKLIKQGLIGDVVGMRCHWFRNADWRRPVPSPEYERAINWRLYKESSGGLMTELACHQLEICTWAAGKMPVEAVGYGDTVFWKDGREVPDSVNVIYRFEDGRKICYESLISNKYNGMEDQILGHLGTMDLSKGLYYLEEDNSTYGIKQLIDNIKSNVFAAVPTAGPSWRPEYKSEYVPHRILESESAVINPGQSMIGVDNDGSNLIMEAFCESCLTGKRADSLVDEAYCATTLCLLGNMAMESGRSIKFPDEYKIPYMNF